MVISVVIPAFNEEKTIGKVVDDVMNCISLEGSEIIVVDNDSTDKTKSIVLSKGVKLVTESERGKGRAMLAGAKEAKGDILVFIDGDDSYPPESIPQLLKPILEKGKDIVVGSRFLDSGAQISLLRSLGNKVFSWIASKLYCYTSDLLTGMVAVRKEVFFSLNLESRSFEIETEIFIKCCHSGFSRTEIPIFYREADSSLSPLIDGFKILKTLLRYKI